MIELHSRVWRNNLQSLLLSVERDLLIASPYIQLAEAEWVCRTLASRTTPTQHGLHVLTDVRSDSVLSGSLDIRALRAFYEAIPEAEVVNLPRLHAKVYLADRRMAIVTSANLTHAGLEKNFEYGVGFKGEAIVSQIRSDLESYARVGNVLSRTAIDALAATGDELVAQYNQLQKSSEAKLKRRFEQTLERVRVEFVKAQVGNRSANSLFSEAITYVLSKGPMRTQDLAPEVKRLLPDLCDDTVELIINGQRFGKQWKHNVRNAQQSLKRRGLITLDERRWVLVHA